MPLGRTYAVVPLTSSIPRRFWQQSFMRLRFEKLRRTRRRMKIVRTAVRSRPGIQLYYRLHTRTGLDTRPHRFVASAIIFEAA